MVYRWRLLVQDPGFNGLMSFKIPFLITRAKKNVREPNKSTAFHSPSHNMDMSGHRISSLHASATLHAWAFSIRIVDQ